MLIDYDLTEQSLAEIVARLRGGEQVNLVLRDGPGAPEGNQNAKKDKGENKPVNHSIVYGTGNRAYTIARLQRDNPELAVKVRAAARGDKFYLRRCYSS